MAILVLLLAPGALAAGGDAIEGDLLVPAPPRLSGHLEAWTGQGALNLSKAVEAGETPALHLRGGAGELVESRWARVLHQVNYRVDRQTRDVLLEEGTLRIVHCDPNCLVLLVTEEGRVGAAGRVDGALAWRHAEYVFCVDFCTPGEGRGYTYASPRGAFLVGGDGLAVPDGAARAEGALTLVLRGAVAEHVAPDGRVLARIDAREDAGRALAPGVEPERIKRHAVLRVDARGMDAPMARVALMGDGLDAALAGEAAAGRATGDLTYAGQPHRAEDENVLVVGDFRLGLAAASGDAPLAGPPAARVHLEGTATRLQVGASAVRPLDPLPAAGGGLLVLLLLALAAVGLYSRIRRDRVLENENRERIVRLLRERPGLTSREIAAALELARVVVQHHLVVLLTHRFVLCQRVGRADRYHATDAPLDVDAMERARSLRDPTRRRIAETVASRGGLTQADVAAATGVSLRLASYHLARLERAGLVTRTGGMPVRYDAAPALRELRDG